MSKKKPAQKPEPKYPKVVETFWEPRMYRITEWEADNKPSCFNSGVHINKYRITVELIDEPVEVLADRLRKLWRESDNMHDMGPLIAKAEQLGVELDWKEHGKDRPKRR